MKPGSLVECIDNSMYEDTVKLKKPYTCREIIETGEIFTSRCGQLHFKAGEYGIRLEEVVGNCTVAGCIFDDMPFPLKDFRELMPPLENIEEFINENSLELQPV